MSELRPNTIAIEETYSNFFRESINTLLEENVEFVINGEYAKYEIQALHLANENDQTDQGIVYKAQRAHRGAQNQLSWGLVMPKIILPGTKRGRYDIGDDTEVTRQYSVNSNTSPTMIRIAERRSAGEARKKLYDKGYIDNVAESEASRLTARTLKTDIEMIEEMHPVKLQALSRAAKHAAA